jgi:hypothetical protein
MDDPVIAAAILCPLHPPPQGYIWTRDDVNLFNAFVLVAKTVIDPIEFSDGK